MIVVAKSIANWSKNVSSHHYATAEHVLQSQIAFVRSLDQRRLGTAPASPARTSSKARIKHFRHLSITMLKHVESQQLTRSLQIVMGLKTLDSPSNCEGGHLKRALCEMVVCTPSMYNLSVALQNLHAGRLKFLKTLFHPNPTVFCRAVAHFW